MSMYSGKYDFYDEIMIFGLDYIMNSNIFIGHDGPKLEFKRPADLVPYFAHIVIMSAGDRNKATIHLSEKSWPQIEAERYGRCRAHDWYENLLKKEIEKAAIDPEHYIISGEGAYGSPYIYA